MAASYPFYSNYAPSRYGGDVGSSPLITYPALQQAAPAGSRVMPSTVYPNQPQMQAEAPGGGEIKANSKGWSWASLGTSIFSVIFCNLGGLVCGTIGMAMAMVAYSDYKSGDHEDAKHKSRVALILAIVAIVIGSICIVAVIVFPLVFGDEFQQLFPFLAL